MADNSNPQGTDLYTAQSAISAMLAPQEDTAATSDANDVEEILEDQEGVEMSEEEYSEDDLEDEVYDEEGDDDQSFDIMSATIDVDGEEITVEELKRGHLRQRDYTRKTQALAEERQALQGEYAQITQERAQYAQMLPLLAQKIEQSVEQEPDWDTLYDADPTMAAKAERQWKKQQAERQAQMQAVMAEQQRMAELEYQRGEQLKEQYTSQQREILPEMIPEWRDSKVAATEAQQVRDFLLAEGLSESQISELRSAILVKLARKAMLYDQGSRNATAAKQKPKAPSKTLRAGSRGSQPQPKSARVKVAQKAQQTGRVADAAEAIKALL